MANYEPDDIAPPSVRDDGTTPSSFAQSGQKAPDGLDLVAGADGKTHASIPCRYCKRYGHYKNQCTDGIKAREKRDNEAAGNEGVSDPKDDNNTTIAESHVQWAGDVVYDDDSSTGDEYDDHSHLNIGNTESGTSHAQAGKKPKASNNLLCDSGSNVHMINNASLLTDLLATEGQLAVKTNGGMLYCNKKGVLPGVGRVWYSPEAITNVLSLDKLSKSRRYWITFHDDKYPSYFAVKSKATGLTLKFVSQGGIYVHGIVNNKSVNDKKTVNNYSHVSLETVESNKIPFTNRQVKRADRVLDLFKATNYASERDIIAMLNGNVIKNCPLTADDVRRFSRFTAV
jgi:hypothetical protein